jgi:hypothetical protein
MLPITQSEETLLRRIRDLKTRIELVREIASQKQWDAEQIIDGLRAHVETLERGLKDATDHAFRMESQRDDMRAQVKQLTRERDEALKLCATKDYVIETSSEKIRRLVAALLPVIEWTRSRPMPTPLYVAEALATVTATVLFSSSRYHNPN